MSPAEYLKTHNLKEKPRDQNRMKRLLIPALCVLAAACTSRGHLYDSATPLAVRMVESEIAPTPRP